MYNKFINTNIFEHINAKIIKNYLKLRESTYLLPLYSYLEIYNLQ
jgi:hypothetical protein